MKLPAIKIAIYAIISTFICVLSCKKDEPQKSYRYTMSTNGRLNFDSTEMVSKVKSFVRSPGKLAKVNSVNTVRSCYGNIDYQFGYIFSQFVTPDDINSFKTEFRAQLGAALRQANPHTYIDVTEEGVFYDGATTDLSYSLKDFIKNAFAIAGQVSNLYPYLDEESIHLYPYGGACQIVDDPFPDPTNPGETAPGTPLSPPVIIIADSLYKKYPCASLIITGLQGIREYADLVAPFQQDLKPNLIWRSDNLTWNPNGGQTMLGNTRVDLSGGLGLGSIITLNNNMMNNSSQLLIAAVSIHETIHAYINFKVALANANGDPNYIFNGSWMNELDFFYDQNSLPPNYRDHYEMMSDYFVKAVYILATFDNNKHTQREYIMAMLYGLNTPDPTSTPQQINNLQTLYQQMQTNYGINESDLNTFWKSQFIAPVLSQLPKSGC